MVDRLGRFREFMERFDAAANPRTALARNFYVPPPERGKRSQIAGRSELEPSGGQLIVGGVGTGKTTELLIAQREINQISDMRARYVDVSRKHDLRKLDDGVLLVIAGLELSKLAREPTEEVRRAKRTFARWAEGYLLPVGAADWYDDDDEGDDHVEVPPVLSPPRPPLHDGTLQKLEPLRTLRAAIPEHVVLLLDSLDRMTDIERFRRVVHQDVRALKSAGVGLVLVGPVRLLYGPDRAAADLFDHLGQQTAVDVGEGPAFLISVLRRRADPGVLPDSSAERLARASGGVLRDLLSLARRSGEEAYMDGAESIESRHVERAVDAFGRTMMLGLRKPELDTLQRLRKKGQFVPTGDDDIALLVTRRVLESPPRRYRVHPAIEPLLAALSQAA